MDSESGGYIVYLSRDGTKERHSNKKVIAKRKCGGGGLHACASIGVGTVADSLNIVRCRHLPHIRRIYQNINYTQCDAL